MSLLPYLNIGLSLYFVASFANNVWAQESQTDHHNNFYKQQAQKIEQGLNELDLIKKAIENSPVIKGYEIHFNPVNIFTPLEELQHHLKLPETSIFKSNIFKNNETDINLKSYVNLNGAAQIITFKGDFFRKYSGNYTLQISYRVSPNDYNINIPNLIKQEVQKGLALKLKINLENGN